MSYSAVALLVVSVATYFGYYVFAVSVRPWIYYPMSGLVFVVAGHVARAKFAADYQATDPALIWRRAGLLGGVAAGSLMIGEGLQQAGCGMVDAATHGVDVCRKVLGSDLHSALASAAVAGLVVWKWPSRH